MISQILSIVANICRRSPWVIVQKGILSLNGDIITYYCVAHRHSETISFDRGYFEKRGFEPLKTDYFFHIPSQRDDLPSLATLVTAPDGEDVQVLTLTRNGYLLTPHKDIPVGTGVWYVVTPKVGRRPQGFSSLLQNLNPAL